MVGNGAGIAVKTLSAIEIHGLAAGFPKTTIGRARITIIA
jgi:hypothetical protein